MKRRLNSCLIVFVCVGLVSVFLLRYFSPAWRFARLPHEKIVAFGKTCEELRLNHPLGKNRVVRVNPNDDSLPDVIKQVCPVYIGVSSNNVIIRAGGGGKISGYTITWTRYERPEVTWEITVFDGVWDHIVLKKGEYVVNSER
jgi:hypothetical protein